MATEENKYWLVESEKKKRFEDVYTKEKLLGEGSTCAVYECIENGSDRRWAVKIMQKNKATSGCVPTETGMLLKLKHKNVIRMKEVYESDKLIHIILELVTGGELFERIVTKGNYSESDAADCIYQILEGIKYLHDNDIAHRDLKPENLLYENCTDDSILKIADFGLSKISSDHVLLQTVCGTPGYCAPEVLKKTKYTRAVDMWATGVIAYILLCGYEPFYDDDQAKVFKKIMKCDFKFHMEWWSDISENAKNLITNLLVLDPAKRLTAGQALQHRWIKGKACRHQHLENTVRNLKEFNGRRKMKAAASAIMAFKMSKLSSLSLAQSPEKPIEMPAMDNKVQTSVEQQ